MQKNIIIDYDAKKGRFVLGAPMWANGLIRAIPNRRFVASNKTWAVPALRVNAKYMEENLGGASWSRLALDKLADIKASVGKMIAPALPWPLHYQFKTEPMRTQKIALERSFGRAAFAFFKDMGTGKTKTLIDLAAASRMHPMIEAVIIVCPVAIRKNWIRELAIHCPLPVDAYLLNSAKPKEFEKWLSTPHDFKWLIVGVESLGISAKPYDMMLQFLRNRRVLLGVDESSKIKNHAAIRTKRVVEAARHAAVRIAMTGTPIAKGVMDLYAQFEFLDPEILGVGDYYSFRARYAVMGGFEDKQIVGYQNMDELTEIMNPFIYQVRKAEALPDLPPKVYTRRYVNMSAEQNKHYKSMAKDKLVISPDGDRSKTVANALEKALRLQQICGGFVAYDHFDPIKDKKITVTEQIGKSNPKVDDLLDFLDEFDGRMIVWCAWKPELDAVVEALVARFGRDQVVELHGGISDEQRDINVNELFQKGLARFVVGNVATGGMGLTMTMADCEYYLSNTHNYIDREQSEDRAHRKGRNDKVLYVDVIAQVDIGGGNTADTIDGAIVASNLGKRDLSEYIRDEIDKLAARGITDLSSIFGV